MYDHCDGISHVRYISTGEKHALLKGVLDIVVETEYCGNNLSITSTAVEDMSGSTPWSYGHYWSRVEEHTCTNVHTRYR